MFSRRAKPAPQRQAGERYVFFVRHAESRWNAAQAAGVTGLYDMFCEGDHGLSEKGRVQAEELNRSFIEARNVISNSKRSSWSSIWLQRLIQAETILSSPYVRAIETAVIGLQDIRSINRKVIVTRDAREMRSSMLAVDCSSSAVGDQIKTRLSEDLEWIYAQAGKNEQGKALTMGLSEQLDISDVQEEWCPALAESVVDLDSRHAALLQRIESCSEGSSCIVVGHSYYFKRFFATYMSQGVHDQVPDVAASLEEHVVPQCAVVGMKIVFEDSGSPLIKEVAPLLGTNLKPPSVQGDPYSFGLCASRKCYWSSCGGLQDVLTGQEPKLAPPKPA